MKDLKEIKLKDISTIKEFKRYDYNYTRVKDFGNNIYLFKMEHINEPLPYSQYELVKGEKKTNTDGSVVYIYPSSSHFGTNGFYICGTEEYCQRRINERLNQLNRE